MSHKILVVDDEADLEVLIRQKFRKQIRDKEYDLRSRRTAWKPCRRSPTSLISPCSLRHQHAGDGRLTLLHRINELKNPVLKAIIVSAYGDMDNIALR